MPPSSSQQLFGRLSTAALRRGCAIGHGLHTTPMSLSSFSLSAARQPTNLPEPSLRPSSSPTPHRPFTCAHGPLRKHHQLPPRPKPPPESEIDEKFLKGSGPGGQKINKTNSAVQLKHKPTGIVVKSQATRSRSQNRLIARQLLADRLDDLAHGKESRSAVVAEFHRRRKAGATKKARSKYRALEERAAAAFLHEGETYVAPGEEDLDEDDKDDDDDRENEEEEEKEQKAWNDR